MATNGEWLDHLAQNAPDELAAWFDAEHVENQERALDGDTDALERKSADLIHEYYKPMVAELQAKVDRLTAERDELKERADYNSHGWAKANIGWAEANAEAEKWQMKCDKYRSKFGKCIDYADAIHALMDDEGMA